MYGRRFFVRRLPEPLPVLSCDGVGETADGARFCDDTGGNPEKEFCALFGLLPEPEPAEACVAWGFGEGLLVMGPPPPPPGGVVALPVEVGAVVVWGLAAYCRDDWLEMEYCCWCWYLLPPVMHT